MLAGSGSKQKQRKAHAALTHWAIKWLNSTALEQMSKEEEWTDASYKKNKGK